MCRSHFFSVVFPFLFVSMGVIGLAGCNDGRPTAQVRGKVLLPTANIANAGIRMIRFECAKDTNAAVRKGASGVINDDGSFELFTGRPGDGVHHGKYDVTFAIFRGATDQRPLIPVKYTKSATTPYHITVDQDLDGLEFRIE